MTTLLIIEDNATNLELMEYLLHEHGYNIITAINGKDAKNLIEKGNIDLVVCDISLPDIEGTEIVAFAKIEKKMSLPVIAVTAYAMVGDRDRFLAYGFDGYITKPINPWQFVSQIEMHLPSHLRSNFKPIMQDKTEIQLEKSSKNNFIILIVDDLKSNLNLLRDTLEPSGFTVITASTGKEALKLMMTIKPNLILADLHLEHERDFEFIENIKKNEDYSKIPFIFLSSTSQSQILVDLALKKGALQFLFRPIGPEVLLSEINRWLDIS